MDKTIKLYDSLGRIINNGDKFVDGTSIFINENDENWYIDMDAREWDISEFNYIPFKDGYCLVDFEKIV